MKSKDKAFQIAEMLFYTYEDNPIDVEKVDKVIVDFAGEDLRTLQKYKTLLVRYEWMKQLPNGKVRMIQPYKTLPQQKVREAKRKYDERHRQEE